MTENSRPKIGGLLLAAGGSRRMGTPKQLMLYKGVSLVRRAAQALIDAAFYPVVVVIGSEAEGSRKELDGLEVVIAENQMWETGMSSSIRVGMENMLIAGPSIDAVLITLCDQPRVTADKLALFSDSFAGGHRGIIAAEYDGIRGVPALFPAAMFDELMDLEGDKGARDLIRSGDAFSIALSEAAIDIDTPEDAAGT